MFRKRRAGFARRVRALGARLDRGKCVQDAGSYNITAATLPVTKSSQENRIGDSAFAIVGDLHVHGGTQLPLHVIDQHITRTYTQTCLEDLRTTGPRDDKKRIEKLRGGLLPNLCRWILHNDDFQQWRDDGERPLLWITGDPGKGKTMLLCGIINELEKSTTDTETLSFFFCQATNARINSATAVLRGRSTCSSTGSHRSSHTYGISTILGEHRSLRTPMPGWP
jgi:hypothetical protein